MVGLDNRKVWVVEQSISLTYYMKGEMCEISCW